jgi:O-antigen/teichoic acid export membrane protein
MRLVRRTSRSEDTKVSRSAAGGTIECVDGESQPSSLRRRRRMMWGAADQAASSFTNLLVAIFVGRAVSPAEFGNFAAAVLAYQIANGLLRGMVSEPVVVRWSGSARSSSEPTIEASLGAAVVLAALVGVAVCGVGLLGGGSFRTQMLLLAVLLPGLQLQDAVRFVALTWARPAVAAFSDLVWCGLMLAGGLALAYDGVASPFPYFAVWAVSGAIAGPVGLLALRVRPRVRRTGSYLSEHSTLVATYGFESVAQRGAPRIATVGIGLLAGVTEFAGFRGAMLFGTQIALLTQTVRLVVIPESVRRESVRAQASLAMRAMWVLVAVTVVGSAILLVVPPVLGRQLLGDTWELAQPLLLWVLIRQVFSAWALGPEIGLRAFANARLSFWSRLANSILLIVLGVAGAAVGGAMGAAIGMAAAQAISTVIWFAAYRIVLRSEIAAERARAEDVGVPSSGTVARLSESLEP